MVLHWKEIKKFLKNNIIKILMGTFFIAGIFLFIKEMPIDSKNDQADSNLNEFGVSDVYPVKFYFYIENEDGTPFQNNLIIEQYLLTRKVLDEILSTYKINLIKEIEDSGNLISVNYSDSGTTKMIGVSKNDNTQLMEFSINLGKNEYNLVIAEYFYNLVLDNKIPFLTNKLVYSFKKPEIVELENKFDLLSQETIVQTENARVKNIILAILLGFIISTFILFITTFFNKKIIYSFSYYIRSNDLFFLLYTHEKKNDEFLLFLTSINSNDTIIVSEKKPENFDNYEKLFSGVKNFIEIENLMELKRIIYLVEEGTTSREWYNIQRRMDSIYEIPTAIIQINK